MILCTGYESFAKPSTKTGLLRVILYYLNLLTPPKNTYKWGFTLLRVIFVLRFVLHLADAIEVVMSFAQDS
jgi:hypothetical protein